MSIFELPYGVRTVLITIYIFVGILSMVDMFSEISRRRKISRALIPAAVTTVCYLCFVGFALVQYKNFGVREPDEIEIRIAEAVPAPVYFAALLISVTVAAISFTEQNVWKRRHISPVSVKEGMDALKTGVCYHHDNGMIKLENIVMYKITQDLFGGSISNGNVLWEKLSALSPVVKLSDGTCYAIKRKELDLLGDRIYEITASDVTEEEAILDELRRREDDLKAYNKRLKRYDESVSRMIYEQEVFDAKLRIHDELGLALLRSKRFVIEGSEDGNELNEIYEMWKSIRAMTPKQSQVDDMKLVLSDVREAAEAIGIELKVEGSVRDLNSRYLRLLTAGARECLTNAFRHANATEVKIDIGIDSIEFTDNGKDPPKEIKEGGGLTNLRGLVEKEGAVMRIETENGFRLIIEEAEEL